MHTAMLANIHSNKEIEMVRHHAFKAVVAIILEVVMYVVSGIASLLAIFAILMTAIVLIGSLIHPQPTYADGHSYGPMQFRLTT